MSVDFRFHTGIHCFINAGLFVIMNHGGACAYGTLNGGDRLHAFVCIQVVFIVSGFQRTMRFRTTNPSRVLLRTEIRPASMILHRRNNEGTIIRLDTQPVCNYLSSVTANWLGVGFIFYSELWVRLYFTFLVYL